MIRKYLTLAAASASLVACGPALAQSRGGGQGAGPPATSNAGTPPAASSHGMEMRTDARANSQGPANASDRAIERSNENSVLHQDTTPQPPVTTTTPPTTDDDTASPTEGRANSQGPAHASDRAMERSNEHSVLHQSTTTPPPTDLSTLREGLVVRDSAGTQLGTIRSVVRSPDGTVRNVIVAGADGQRRTLRVAPGTLSISGDVVTTTDTMPPRN